MSYEHIWFIHQLTKLPKSNLVPPPSLSLSLSLLSQRISFSLSLFSLSLSLSKKNFIDSSFRSCVRIIIQRNFWNSPCSLSTERNRVRESEFSIVYTNTKKVREYKIERERERVGLSVYTDRINNYTKKKKKKKWTRRDARSIDPILS